MSSNHDEGQRRGPESKPPWSLARRLTVWYLFWFSALTCVVTVFNYRSLDQGLAEVDDGLLHERIRVLGKLLNQKRTTSPELSREIEADPQAVHNQRLYVRILDGDGKPLIQTAGMSQLLPTEVFPAATASTEQRSLRVQLPSGRVFAVMSATTDGSAAGRTWTLQVAYERTALEMAVREHEGEMAMVLAAVCLAALGLGYYIVRSGLKPLREIVEATREIQGTNLSRRVHVKAPVSEVASLAATFNDMMDRLNRSFLHVSKFSADIAHELRTPLANLRGEAEVALSKERPADQYREVLFSSLEEYDHLASVIDRLLFLALAERSEGCVERRLVNVGEELMSIANFFEPAASEMNLSLQLAANGDLCMNADPVLVRRAVSNLVSNAIAHTPPGGTVGLAAFKQQTSIRVVVADSGEGIPAEHLPHVFDRFYRVTPVAQGRRGGAGLGLSIVKAVMNLHKGFVDITSAPGKGTCVILEFPLMTNS